MSTVLRVAALVLLLAGFAAEGGHVLRAPGLALALGACLFAYLWFLAIARRPIGPSQRRRT